MLQTKRAKLSTVQACVKAWTRHKVEKTKESGSALRVAKQRVIQEVETGELICPNCGVPETHPNGDHVLIRGCKVFDDEGAWSQCLVCAGYYNETLDNDEAMPEYDKEKGWFCD